MPIINNIPLGSSSMPPFFEKHEFAKWLNFLLLHVPLSVALLSMIVISAFAQPQSVIRSEQAKSELNANKVGIVTGVPGGTYNRMGMDLSAILEDRATDHPLRVIVLNSLGSVQNLDYLLNLRGVDIAMMQSDVL
jgi:TRAP-type uncharacterized transport system substrate-binding protein